MDRACLLVLVTLGFFHRPKNALAFGLQLSQKIFVFHFFQPPRPPYNCYYYFKYFHFSNHYRCYVLAACTSKS